MSRVDVSFAIILTSKPMSGYEFCNGKKENKYYVKCWRKQNNEIVEHFESTFTNYGYFVCVHKQFS